MNNNKNQNHCKLALNAAKPFKMHIKQLSGKCYSIIFGIKYILKGVKHFLSIAGCGWMQLKLLSDIQALLC